MRLFEPNRNETTKKCKNKLSIHNEKLHNVLSSPKILIRLNQKELTWQNMYLTCAEKYTCINILLEILRDLKPQRKLDIKRTTFWDITPCSPLKVNRRFGGTYRLHLQVRKISRARNQVESRWQAGPNVGCLSTEYTALYPRRWYSS
jgi:hypothetical protein